MFERLFNNKDKREEFSELYNENFDYVYSFVFIRTACDAQITEEIVQEAFTAAWQAQDRFRNKSTFRTWLCGIAKNKLYEYYRRNAANGENQIHSIESIEEQPSGFEIESIVLKNEMKTQVLKALNQINPIYRYTLIMKYIDGYSIKEIAKHLGRTTKAVDGVLQKSKNSFIKEYIKIEERGNSHE